MDSEHELGQFGGLTKSGLPRTNAPSNGESTDLSLAAKYSSDAHDREMLARLGKRQVLKRNFGFMSMLSFSCTVLATWEALLISFTSGLDNGGPAGLVYGFVFVWIGTLSVFITIAELASIAPTAGGQYHWVSMLAPKAVKNLLSYITGWLTILAWQSTVASGGYLSGTMIQGLLILNYPDYVPRQWHGTLLFWAVILLNVFVNTVVSTLLPTIEGAFLVLHVLGYFAILIPLTYMAPHGSASDVFTLFLNEGGWSTQGLSLMVGLIGVAFSFVGADAAVHLSEEIENPSVTVPRSIVASIVGNGFLGFGMLMATLFGLGNVQNVLNSPTGFPYLEIFYQATRSLKGTTAMSSIIVALAICSNIGSVATSSRMIWSFARDRGLPFSDLLSKIEPRSSNPLYAVTVTTVAAMLLALINLGSSTVLNDVLSLSIAGFYGTYFISCALLLWHRCFAGAIQESIPSRLSATAVDPISGEFRLVWGPWRVPGHLGIANNAFACTYMVIVWFFGFWPPTDPATPATMNYSSLVAGALVLFGLFYYFVWGRKHYKGPIVEICL